MLQEELVDELAYRSLSRFDDELPIFPDVRVNSGTNPLPEALDAKTCAFTAVNILH
jgi:hypothetical protein